MRFEVDGHAIDYEVRGEGKPIVLLHGLTTDRRILIESCEPLFETQPGWKRYYLDLPGHGASKGNPQRASADSLVEAIAKLMLTEFPSVKPLLVGYAYGGYLAQGVLREVPLGGLFLACPVIEPDFARRAVPPRRLAHREADLPFGSDEREREAFVEIAVHHTRAVLERFQRAVHPANIVADQEFIAATRYRYAQGRTFSTALGLFEGPVGIVCGRDDHWVGFSDAVEVARLCRRSSMTVLANCGQLLPIEAPEAFRTALAEWLSRVV